MALCAVRRIRISLDDTAGKADGRLSRATVLLVTPDVDLRAAAGRALEAAGYEVHPAAHAGHALLASLTTGRIDVLVTELSMEDVSGPSLAEKIRRYHPDVQTLFFGHAGTRGTEGILVRPFTRDDLLEGMEVAANARRAASCVRRG